MRTQQLTDVPEKTQEALLLYLKRDGEMTVSQLVELLGVTAMAVRRHLAALQKDGLIESRLEKKLRGRPTYKYKLTGKSESLFPSGFQNLAVDLLDLVFEQSGHKGVMDLLTRRNSRLADRLRPRVENKTLAEKVEEVSKIFSENGYMTEWKKLDDGDFIIYQQHCAVRDLAMQYRQLCILEPRLMQDLLGVKISRTKYILQEDSVCAYLVHSREVSDSSDADTTSAEGGVVKVLNVSIAE